MSSQIPSQVYCVTFCMEYYGQYSESENLFTTVSGAMNHLEEVWEYLNQILPPGYMKEVPELPSTAELLCQITRESFNLQTGQWPTVTLLLYGQLRTSAEFAGFCSLKRMDIFF